MAGDRRCLCPRCWEVFEQEGVSHCPDRECRLPRPPGGWPRLPYRFRDRYLFEERIGRGGMGAVFRATDPNGQEHRQVAVKVVKELDRPGEASMMIAQFEHEATGAALPAWPRSCTGGGSRLSRGRRHPLVGWLELGVSLNHPYEGWVEAVERSQAPAV